ncbi:MAG: AAA family ATPase [Caldilineaceae bacterium]|nr:AAA family ATPase [Caldilineaceae bacterium]
MNITQFTIEEVRCFANRQHFNIRPLTFLVGENSTGKTTALACFQVLADFIDKGVVDFNSQPYSLGVFDDIVRRSRKPEKEFALGFSFQGESDSVELVAKFVEKAKGLEPDIGTVTIKFHDGVILFQNRDTSKGTTKAGFNDEVPATTRINVRSSLFDVHPPFSFLGALASGRIDGQISEEVSLAKFLGDKYVENKGLFRLGVRGNTSAFSTSPVRSRPRRTYDPTRESLDPEGSDIPMFLMRLAATSQTEWESLRQQLIDFGRASGLFEKIEVRKLGPEAGAPFQLKLRVRGPNSNIVDVGYGVSQVLPLLVHAMVSPLSPVGNETDPAMRYFLMQQPEVHLHPKAQAELSSLLVRLASQGGKSFIVETHSDYLVDRARIEIRRGNITAEDVSLIYLEPKKNVVKVHNISFDKMGNMIGVPPHFREFFLLESERLMGFED